MDQRIFMEPFCIRKGRGAERLRSSNLLVRENADIIKQTNENLNIFQ